MGWSKAHKKEEEGVGKASAQQGAADEHVARLEVREDEDGEGGVGKALA